MATDDKKEYKNVLVILAHVGTGPSVLNKLNTLMAKMEDPFLKGASAKLVSFFGAKREFAHTRNFQLLHFASQYAMNDGRYKNASDCIYAIQQHCQKNINSQVPQWQLIALAAGWTPPAPSTAVVDARLDTRQLAAGETFSHPAPISKRPPSATSR